MRQELMLGRVEGPATCRTHTEHITDLSTLRTSEVALLGELPQMICMVCANLGLFLYFLASSLDVGVSGGFAAQSGCAGSCARRVVGFRCAQPKLSWIWQLSNWWERIWNSNGRWKSCGESP